MCMCRWRCVCVTEDKYHGRYKYHCRYEYHGRYMIAGDISITVDDNNSKCIYASAYMMYIKGNVFNSAI